ncbi:MAG: tetratricopeptide repeat protein, partial [Planctomycetaceae bacterium]
MHSRKLSQWTGIGLTLATVLLVVWLIFNRPAAQADRWLSAARQLRTSGQFADAEQAALRALALNPQLVAAAFLAAESAERQQAFDRTTGYLQQLKTTHPEHQLQANLMIARLSADKMNQLSVAERAWRDALKLAPNHIEANSALFRLLTQTGRASEATPFALRVVRSNAAEDLLVPLARPGGSDASRQKLAQCRLASPDDAAPLVGLALLASLTDRHEDAIELLDAALRIDADNAAAHAALGNALLQSEQYDRLSKWQRHLPRQAENFPGIWLVRAKLAEHASSSAAAIRCYWELCRLQPESRVACSRLARLLAAAGRTDAAGQFAKRLRLLTALASAQDRVLFSDQSENASALFQLAGLYRQTGRFWEAYGWCLLATQIDAQHEPTARLLASLRNEIRGRSLKQTAEEFNPALSVDLSDFALPGKPEMLPPDQNSGPGPAS